MTQPVPTVHTWRRGIGQADAVVEEALGRAAAAVEEALDWDDIAEPAPAAPASAREWSPQQRDVFAFVAEGKGHGVVEALAGTGKSTTIEEAVRRAPADAAILVAAFNKSIAEAMKPRLADVGCDVMTLHSLGLRTVTQAHGRREVDGRYIFPLIREHVFDREAQGICKKLIGLAKGSLLEGTEALDAALDAHSIDVEPRHRKAIVLGAHRVLQRCAQATKGPIDFDDMIWLPVVQGLRAPRYEYVFVDETQDLNPAQLWLVREAAETGRIIAVGDRRQSIYGFRGADREAIPRMITELKATVMPLNTTYRCARAIVREANGFVSELRAAPTAAEGTVRHAGPDALLELQPGDMVLSRVNAPLVKLAFSLLADGVRCRIQGRNIGEGLVKLIEMLAKKAASPSVPQLMVALRKWHSGEVQRLVEAERETQEVDDKAACIEALCEGKESIGEVRQAADRLFADDGPEGILLSSTHRAKGLEADRVWLLWDTYRPSAGYEEKNLCYVAITRAKRELIYVHDDGGEAETEGEP